MLEHEMVTHKWSKEDKSSAQRNPFVSNLLPKERIETKHKIWRLHQSGIQPAIGFTPALL
jgi:hypothetical protein